MTISDSLNGIFDNIKACNDHVTRAHSKGFNGLSLLTEAEIETAINASYLKLYIGLESYLEAISIQYMMGSPTASGTQVVKYVVPKDEDNAKRMIIGTNRYFDWSDPDKVRSMCDVVFENGGPIKVAISSSLSDLKDMRTIRNAAAHISSTTTTQLDSLASRIFTRPFYKLKVNDLLMRPDPRVNGRQTVFQHYSSIIETLAIAAAN
jgi:hypothetical protein